MHQKLQEEAQPKKNKVDQGVPKGIGKRVDSGEWLLYSATYYWYFIDFSYVLFHHFPCAQDNSLEFEKRRNIPVKYNRELWQKTGNVYKYFHWAF